MTLEEAVDILTLEFDFTHPDEVRILEDAISKVISTAYREGWGNGYAEALNMDAELDVDAGDEW